MLPKDQSVFSQRCLIFIVVFISFESMSKKFLECLIQVSLTLGSCYALAFCVFVNGYVQAEAHLYSVGVISELEFVPVMFCGQSRIVHSAVLNRSLLKSLQVATNGDS